jgi:hypothetical protein
VTLIWFVVWLIANNVGNPVNAWTATLILAIALDLARGQPALGSRGAKCRSEDQ